MISAFRKIRTALLKENKLNRYSLYAVGEILLVMIGILLALQVNNWNEQRKTNNLEIQMLEEIKAGLTTDLQDIDYNINEHNNILRSQIVIRDWVNSDASYFDSLSHHFSIINGSTVFVANSGPYSTLKDIGVRIITNDNLREKIVKVYDLDFDYYLDHVVIYNDMVIHGWREVNAHYFDGTMFKFSNPDNKMTPFDTIKIRSENRYRYYINTIIDLNRFYISSIMKNAQQSASELIEMIDQELENRE